MVIEDLEILLDSAEENDLVLSRFVLNRHILVENALNRKGVFSILRGIWSEEVVPCIREMGINNYSFNFKYKNLTNRAIEEEPWLIMGCCLVLQRWEQGLTLEKVDLSKVHFWA
ncbi:hypothetical protein REPUB_Repub03eG0121100 [Reevesia pubescens]